ncbi:MAG TPA: hypothetical protein VNV17_11260 [Solirubrobacteraceae bacterium]|nr:hypothetical protein [Solirubrobacteraceae bacterium]
MATTVVAGGALGGVAAGGVGVEATGATGVVGAVGAAGERRRTPAGWRPVPRVPRVPAEWRALVRLPPVDVLVRARCDAAGVWPRAATNVTPCLAAWTRR